MKLEIHIYHHYQNDDVDKKSKKGKKKEYVCCHKVMKAKGISCTNACHWIDNNVKNGNIIFSHKGKCRYKKTKHNIYKVRE